ncbi:MULTISPECIES: hypothetical protein [unclassified Herbaspirillum]|uniref:hypothetical protein n=1 Tax=unclassified Herbaspirillum TaxID=2624150 RepID=UPI000E2EA287|nr:MULTISPECIES: hypothetical protein [unclassified Herbaspirillum]RFB72941.1 hypothetical protein DZB54_01015 [Herbaspirillum sp. 3R-3a1]TFI11250.1 hypothetical protein E4P32_07160 [Herbaspirillum sp. 3R11]TFI17158.1 hypothetical protein E4P31_07155 [Herbaspirillum sp. 3R-11]TFI28428.1 hypothetical protein E4P30_07655 [Herbaspirillum sp. 3C11]
MHSPKNNPWKKNAVSIHLSPQRRGKLADYATALSHPMTPSEAIYTLIDTAAERDNEEPGSLSRVKVEVDDLLAHMQTQAAMIQDCAKALYAVSQALISIEDTIRNLPPLERDD